MIALANDFAGCIAGQFFKTLIHIDQREILLPRIDDGEAVARFVQGLGEQVPGNIFCGWNIHSEVHDAPYFPLDSFKFLSSSAAGKKPGDCVPLAKIRFGVPLTWSFWPRASTLSVWVAQDAFAGAISLNIQSAHALIGFFAQSTLRTISSEPGKIGYMKKYSVTSLTWLNSFSSFLQ